MAADATPNNELTGSVLFYNRPEPLNPDQHGKWGVKRIDNPFAFAAKTNLVPLTVTEFGVAAVSYPVIFVGDDFYPAAIMGLRSDQNLFIDAGGQFEADNYIPAFMRRVPFVFANDESQDRMILCIDGDAPMVDKTGGDVPLFDKGEPTPFVQQAMDFCREFEGERQRTVSFVQLLRDLDLFEVKKALFTPANADGTAGEPQTVAEYHAVSEEKLNKLPDAKIVELVRNGAMQQICAHLVSLVNWDRLISRAMRRDAGAANDTVGNA